MVRYWPLLPLVIKYDGSREERLVGRSVGTVGPSLPSGEGEERDNKKEKTFLSERKAVRAKHTGHNRKIITSLSKVFVCCW
jgi:hypothetical protein